MADRRQSPPRRNRTRSGRRISDPAPTPLFPPCPRCHSTRTGFHEADQRRVDPLVPLRSLRPRVVSRAVKFAHIDNGRRLSVEPIGFCQYVVARQNDDHVPATERTAGPHLRALQTAARLRGELSLGRRRGRPMGSLQMLELWRTLRVSPPDPADAQSARPHRLMRPSRIQ